MGGDAHATNTGWKAVPENMTPRMGPFDKLRIKAGLIRGVGGIWLWMGGDIEIWDLRFTIWDFLRLPRRPMASSQ